MILHLAIALVGAVSRAQIVVVPNATVFAADEKGKVNIRLEPGSKQQILSQVPGSYRVEIIGIKTIQGNLNPEQWYEVNYLLPGGKAEADDNLKKISMRGYIYAGNLIKDGNGDDISTQYAIKETTQEAVYKLQMLQKPGAPCGPLPLPAKGNYRGLSSSVLDQDSRPQQQTFKRLMEAVEASKNFKDCINETARIIVAPNSIWGRLGNYEKMNRIAAHADYAYDKVRQHPSTKIVAGAENYFKPGEISTALTPHAMACIAFQEVKGGYGQYSPHAINETYCSRKFRGGTISTAQSLNMSTKSTFVDAYHFWPDDPRQSMQLTTVSPLIKQMEKQALQKYDSASTKTQRAAAFQPLFEIMNDDVPMQMEVLLRTLNLKIKNAQTIRNRKGPSVSAKQQDLYALIDGICLYDQDSASAYMANVIKCISELKANSPMKKVQEAMNFDRGNMGKAHKDLERDKLFRDLGYDPKKSVCSHMR